MNLQELWLGLCLLQHAQCAMMPKPTPCHGQRCRCRRAGSSVAAPATHTEATCWPSCHACSCRHGFVPFELQSRLLLELAARVNPVLLLLELQVADGCVICCTRYGCVLPYRWRILVCASSMLEVPVAICPRWCRRSLSQSVQSTRPLAKLAPL